MFLSPLGEASFEELVDIYTEQAAGLEEAGVDLFVIETMMTLSDARAAVLAVRSVSDKPIFVTFTCDESGRSPVRNRRHGGTDRFAGHGHKRFRP